MKKFNDYYLLISDDIWYLMTFVWWHFFDDSRLFRYLLTFVWNDIMLWTFVCYLFEVFIFFTIFDDIWLFTCDDIWHLMTFVWCIKTLQIIDDICLKYHYALDICLLFVWSLISLKIFDSICLFTFDDIWYLITFVC